MTKTSLLRRLSALGILLAASGPAQASVIADWGGLVNNLMSNGYACGQVASVLETVDTDLTCDLRGDENTLTDFGPCLLVLELDCVDANDLDGDGWSTADGDCDDNEPSAYPGAAEICDGGIDNDCDSTTSPSAGSSGFVSATGDVRDMGAAPQGALTLATSGTLYLCDGLWSTTLTIAADNVSIVGSGQDTTVLAGKGQFAVVSATSVTGLSIDALTLAGGAAANGGGLSLDNATATVTNTTIAGNSALFSGGGVYLTNGSSLSLSGSTIDSNTATFGAGLYLGSSSAATLSDTTISGNSASVAAGGLYLKASTATVSGATFSNNSGADLGGGLLLYDSSSASLSDTTLEGNSADFGGGMMLSGSEADLDTVTVSNNSAGTAGGGLFVEDASVATLVDTAFASNTAVLGGGAFLDTSALSATTCDFVGNNVGDTYHDNASTSYTWGTGASFTCDIGSCY